MAKDGDDVKASGSTPSVFISYASLDSAIAETACEALEKAGVTCWIAPRDVTPGAFYGDEIVHAIDAAKAIVLILSQNAATSPHVLREVERAASKRHAVISLRIDRAPLPAGLEYFLNTSQWLDASSGDTARALPKLVSAVQVAIQAPAVTPLGVPTANVPLPAVSARLPRRIALVAASVVGLGLALFAGDRLWLSRHRAIAPAAPAPAAPAPAASAPAPTTAAPTIPEKSVAVLPFVDMSQKKDQEYFSDGLSEELIDMLAKVPDLHVPARTSSFYFKGKQTTIADIGKALSVSHVLEGSVRKSANKLRVTAQLIRVDNGYHVWSDTYDRKLDDIFKMQDEIAGEVVRALKVSLGANEVPRDASTKSTKAYDLLLQARSLIYRSANDCKRAADYYQQVVQLDPNAAVAWAELSEALNCSAFRPEIERQVRARALQAAERSIAVDPKLAEAHVALAKIRYWLDWDWAAASFEYQKAHELDPAHAIALTGVGVIALLHGNLSDAQRLFEQAVARDPLNADAIARLSDIYFAMGQFKDAAAATRKVIELAPDWPGSHAGLSQTLLALGQQDAALAEIEKEHDPGFHAYALARSYIVLGRRVDAESALRADVVAVARPRPRGIPKNPH